MTRAASGTRLASSARAITPPPLAGVWALRACAQISDVQGADVSAALANSWVKGFSMRVPWAIVANSDGSFNDSLGMIQAADAMRKASGISGQQLAVRFVAGARYPSVGNFGGTPAGVCSVVNTYNAAGGDPCASSGDVVPLPFHSDGSPNTEFETIYQNFLTAFIPYCLKYGVSEIRAPWYGDQFAELNHGLELRSAPGYTYNNMLTAHQRLFDIAYNACVQYGLPIEHPLSGCGPLNQLSPDLATYMLTKSRPDLIYIQGNGAGMQSYGFSLFGASSQTSENQVRVGLRPGLQFGAQMIQPGDYSNWPGIFQGAMTLGCRVFEIYTNLGSGDGAHPGQTSFSGTNNAVLAAIAPKYNAWTVRQAVAAGVRAAT